MAEFIQHDSGLWLPDTAGIAEGATVFCDESGNTGPNYLDETQPFYILGGWLVPDSRIIEVSVAVDQFRIDNFGQRDELKATAVLRNERTKMLCAELFRALFDLDCAPMFVVAEKKYCIAAKVIETFIDPVFNDAVRNPFTLDVTTKQEIANTLLEVLPNSAIEQFAEAYREPTARDLSEALYKVVETLESHVSPELAELVGGCKAYIEEIAEIEAAITPLGDVAGALNTPSLVTFLMLVENLGRLGLQHPIQVVHDQQHAYGTVYEYIYELHKGLPGLFLKLPHSEVGYANLEHVASFSLCDSKLSTPVQAADLLAGAVNHCFRISTNGTEPSEGDRAIAESVLPVILSTEPQLAWTICSDRCTKELGQSFLRSLLPGGKHAAIKNPVAALATAADLPMFPKNHALVATDQLKLRVDLPLWGLVGCETGDLMIVNNQGSADPDSGRMTYLFSSQAQTDEFLRYWDEDELTQRQQAREFGPERIVQLIGLLEESARNCGIVVIVADDYQICAVRISEFVHNLRRILGRLQRTFRGGIDAVIIKTHDLGNEKAMTLYCHDGQYAAMLRPRGKIYFGSTRNEALSALRDGEFPEAAGPQ